MGFFIVLQIKEMLFNIDKKIKNRGQANQHL